MQAFYKAHPLSVDEQRLLFSLAVTQAAMALF
jgi:hypothetical protein